VPSIWARLLLRAPPGTGLTASSANGALHLSQPHLAGAPPSVGGNLLALRSMDACDDHEASDERDDEPAGS